MTKQLLAFSRRQPLSPVSIDLNGLVRGLMRMLERLLPESIVIELREGGSLATVSVDVTQLEQVVVNLCVNARDAMQAGGKLVLQTENVVLCEHACESSPWVKPGEYVALRVKDSGVGMTAEVRERAFEPFFTTKSAHEGTGLGLSIVYGIVEQHGGAVQVQSELGVGTTVSVYLPASGRAVAELREERAPAPARGHETILIAEDEELVRRPLIQLLEDAGYRTLGAENGVAALRVLREQTTPVHLVILDVVMPELSGPETWERMQSVRPGMRVLFTSGYANGRACPRARRSWPSLYSMQELLRRVRKTLDA